MLQVSIYRYNPETDSEPYMQDLEVDTDGKDLMVLDVLELIKAQDSTVAFRRSCREGVCGSDALNMNGKNGLACITPLSETVKNNRLVVRPLPGLPAWLSQGPQCRLSGGLQIRPAQCIPAKHVQQQPQPDADHARFILVQE